MEVAQEEVLQLANRLLQHTGVARYVQNLRQCNSCLFTQLYEVLTGAKVPGLVLHAPTSDSVKCQAVIDALSHSLHPHISLAHIQGELLAQHDTMAIKHLLDIFSVLFCLPQPPEEEEEGWADDSNTISNEGLTVISEVIREELGTSYSTDSTADLLCPVPRARLPELQPLRGGRREESSSITGPSSSHGTCSSRHTHTPDATPPLSITTLEDTTDSQREGSSTPPLTPHKPVSTLSSDTPKMGTHPTALPSHELAPSAALPCTPPRQKAIRPPLHHSTPHAPAKSRVFETNKPHPPSKAQRDDVSQAEHPTTATPKHRPPAEEPGHSSMGGTYYYYTELTHPPRLERAGVEREAVRVTRGAHSAPEGMSKPQSDRDRLTTERERMLRSGQSPQLQPVSTNKVSSATQTELSQVIDSSDEEQVRDDPSQPVSTTSPTRPQPDAPMVHFSSHVHLRKKGKTKGSAPAQEEEDEGEVYQRSDLESRIAMTRTNVLSALYRNYLKELKKSSATPVTGATRTHRTKKSNKTRVSIKPKPTAHHPKAKPQQGGRPPSPSPPPSGQPSGSSSDESEHTSSEGEDDGTTPQPKTQPKRVAVGDNLLPLVENEFPFVHVSPSTMRRLWQKQLQQITALTRPQTQQSTSLKKFAEMDRRHTALLQVIRKELEHTRRMQRQLEQRHRNQSVKSTLHARRQASARARKYYNEYELRMKAKLQKRRTKEEKIFRQAFEEGLEMQRDRVRELRRYAKEKKQSLAREQQDHLESLENYYRDQFAMLAESITREREEVTVREKAQTQLVRRMRRELRERIEREIQQLQECIDREEDAAHFRELDAQGLRHKLTFTTSVR